MRSSPGVPGSAVRGAWFHGTIYPRRSEISGDGRLFAYFALTRLIVGPLDLLSRAAQRVAAGARQEITNVSKAPERKAGEKFEDDGTGAEKLVSFLEQLKVV